MPSFTDIFGNANVNTANPSYTTVTLTALIPNVTLVWPVQFQDTANVTANIIDITADAALRTITMPQANIVSVGQALIFNNLSAFAVTVLTADGVTPLVVLAPTTVVEVYLINNTTASIPTPAIIIGTWRSVPWGGGTVSITSISAVPAAGVTTNNLTIAPPTITTIGTFTFTFIGDVAALANFGAGTGIAARTAANTWALRTITGTLNQVTVVDGGGVAANPTISLPNDVVLLNSITAGNIKILGNTISSLNANGDINIQPNGTGGIKSTASITFMGGTSAIFDNAGNTFSTTFYAPAGLAANFTNSWPVTVPTAGQVLSATAVTPGNPNLVTLGWQTVPVISGGATTINAIARFSNASGQLTNSGVLIDNANAMTGATSITVRNLQLGIIDANTLSNSASNVILSPAGGFEVQSATNLTVLGGNSLKLVNGGNFTGLKAGTLSGSTTFSLPIADGTLGQSVITNAAAALSFATIPGINRIVNGDFQVWQRGAGGAATFSITNANQYGPDRWQIESGAATAATFSQQGGTTSGSFLCRAQRDNANAGTATIIVSSSLWRFMCLGVSGNTVTLSFLARRGANFSGAANQITVSIFSGTGTNDVSNLTTGFTGPSVVVSQLITLTTNFSNFSITTPALGATITQLEVRFSHTPTGAAGAADYFDVTDVQLEVSPVQTPFQRIGFDGQYLACLPLYQKSFKYITLPAQNIGTGTGEQRFSAVVAAANTNRSPTIPFRIPLAANATTITTYNPSAADIQIRDLQAGACTGTTISNVFDKGFNILCVANAGTVVGNELAFHWTVDVDVV